MSTGARLTCDKHVSVFALAALVSHGSQVTATSTLPAASEGRSG